MSPKAKSSVLANRSQPDPAASFFDEEEPLAVPLQLISRLAAQDPTVQLKIGMVEPAADGLPVDEEKRPKTGE